MSGLKIGHELDCGDRWIIKSDFAIFSKKIVDVISGRLGIAFVIHWPTYNRGENVVIELMIISPSNVRMARVPKCI